MTNEPLRVADIMSRDVKSLGRNDKLSIADDIMKQDRIRHTSVLEVDQSLGANGEGAVGRLDSAEDDRLGHAGAHHVGDVLIGQRFLGMALRR